MANKKLTDLVGGPYVIKLIDETVIHLNEFTLYGELWASKTFGSMEDFNKKILGDMDQNGNGTKPDLRAILTTILFLMDEKDRKRFDTEEDLAKKMNYTTMAEAAKVLLSALFDSLPEELLKKSQTMMQKRNAKILTKR